ncbi:MAG: ACT domain-containing protein [Candidatus Bathyarchaeia archaeon]
MKFDLTLAVADRPGQLIRALEPVAKNGGNIISIMHEREKPAAGYVPVRLVVDFPSDKNFRKTIDDFKNLDIVIIKSEEIVERTRVTVILVGRMDLKKIVETSMEDIRVTNFEVSALSSKEACVKLDLEIPVDSVDEVVEHLKKISRKENVLLISSV